MRSAQDDSLEAPTVWCSSGESRAMPSNSSDLISERVEPMMRALRRVQLAGWLRFVWLGVELGG